MAYRSGVRGWVEGEGMAELERNRGTRSRKYSLSGAGPAWDESKRLYMDNLRLWDCLTLVRGDPNLTCQGAINLVFSLDDDDYLRAFPDTSQLMQLRYPRGAIYHPDPDEARTEKMRLQDENARLHAAVWVLRDNPSLQADSTVAAIFRLDEAQFQSKFHVEYDNLSLGKGRTQDTLYQNNNKAKRWSYRESLDVGNEPNMAIQLSNLPLTVGLFSRRCRSMSSDKQRLFGIPPGREETSSRKRSGSAVHNRDFTSNWKPTSPCSSTQSHGFTWGGIYTHDRLHGNNSMHPQSGGVCGRQPENSLYDKRVELAYKEPEKHNMRRGHSPRTSNLRRRKGVGKLKRCNTVPSSDSIHSDKTHSRPGCADPIKCISFEEPATLYKPSPASAPGSGYITFIDKVKAILDGKYEHNAPCGKHVLCSSVATKSAECLSQSDVNSNKGSYSRNGVSGFCPSIEPKEPTKRYQRDIAQSPVLKSRPSFLDLNVSNGPQNTPLCDMRIMLNKNANNDDARTTARVPSAPSLRYPKCCRPKSPKRRDFHSAREKNLASYKRKLKEVGPSICERITTNANNVFMTEEMSMERPSQRHVRISSFNMDIGNVQCNRGIEEEDGRKSGLVKKLMSLKSVLETKTVPPDAFSPPSTSVYEESSTPVIYFSKEPAPPHKKGNQPYPFRTYTTVKHFLDRHRRLTEHDLFFKTGKEFFTREITPSVDSLVDDKYRRWKQNRSCAGEPMAVSEESKTDDQRLVPPKPKLALQETTWPRRSSGTRLSIISRPTIELEKTDTTSELSLPGKLKRCDSRPSCGKEDALKTLKSMGNYKYTKPLGVMLSRNGCYQWKPHMPPKKHSR